MIILMKMNTSLMIVNYRTKKKVEYFIVELC
jgi:hypothetical protein